MNIAFFLKPKIEVVYVNEKYSLEKTIEILEKYKYGAIPIIDDKGKYVGTLTEGDVLWYLKNLSKDNEDLRDKLKYIKTNQVPRRIKNSPVKINSNIESLISIAVSQNFVPVVDDENVFIGIITRSSIIDYCFNELKDKEQKIV